MPHHLVGDAASAPTVATTAQLEVPLRNLMLTSIAANAFRHGGPLTLAVGTTADNSFGDGSRQFFDACETVLSLDLGAPVRVETPYIGLSKWQVIQSSDPDLLSLSWSCVTPNGTGIAASASNAEVVVRRSGLLACLLTHYKSP
jgi:7-cyano-7-deazaguanine synthase in queuosine biosynthesis